MQHIRAGCHWHGFTTIWPRTSTGSATHASYWSSWKTKCHWSSTWMSNCKFPSSLCYKGQARTAQSMLAMHMQIELMSMSGSSVTFMHGRKTIPGRRTRASLASWVFNCWVSHCLSVSHSVINQCMSCDLFMDYVGSMFYVYASYTSLHHHYKFNIIILDRLLFIQKCPHLNNLLTQTKNEINQDQASVSVNCLALTFFLT